MILTIFAGFILRPIKFFFHSLMVVALPVILAAAFPAMNNGLISRAYAQESGLPIPRFVSLRSDLVHLRAGPGLRYPKVWIYHRQNMPMEVIAEFDTWRKVRDWEGSEGWIHQSLLIGSRHVIVTADTLTLYSAPDKTARKIALVKTNVIGRIETCPKSVNWCEIKFGDYEGWTPREGFWGIYKNEYIEE